MKSTIIRVVVWGSVAIATIVVLYLWNTKRILNNCISEAKAFGKAGDEERTKIKDDEFRILDGAVPPAYRIKRVPVEPGTAADKPRGGARVVYDLDQDKLAKPVAAADEKIKKVIDNFNNAAAKFTEARKYARGTADTYLDLKSQCYKKRAEAEEDRRQAMLLLVDKSVAETERTKQRSALTKQAFDAERQYEKFSQDAEKLEDEKTGTIK